jgi:hypothetical protein
MIAGVAGFWPRIRRRAVQIEAATMTRIRSRASGANISRGRAFARVVAAAMVTIFSSAGVSTAQPYANGLPADPHFFPIGVWLQSPRNAAEFAAIGINTFVGLDQGPTEAQLSALAAHGMHAIAAQNDAALASPHAAVMRGWMLADEPDNAQRRGILGLSCTPPDEVAAATRALKDKDRTRPVLINFGRGVAVPDWIGRGTCTGDVAYYAAASKGADILAFDVYPVAGSPDHPGQLELVGKGVANLRRWTLPSQLVWADIETTRISAQERVTPDQLKSEVWMALIHGANGIVYFVHEWTGGFREDGVFRYPETIDAIRQIDATIKELAPILNAPTSNGEIGVTSAVPIAMLTKRYGTATYLFAIATSPREGRASFTVGGVPSGAAKVVDEQRTLPIVDGRFEDDFGPYATHAYKIE